MVEREILSSKKQETPPLTAIDLFSGCGGVTTGLKIAGYKVLAAVELDYKARQTYAANHSDVWLVGNDIRLTSPLEIMEKLGISPGQLDLLAGCPPCQGFSRMRKLNKSRTVKDERNSLIGEFVRYVQTFLPKMVMIENVPGLTKYYRFQDTLRELQKLGYKIRYEVLDVADFGVPQRRKRLIVSASRISNPVMAKSFGTRLSVRSAISYLPLAGSSGDMLHDFPETRSERVRDLINAIPKNGGSRSQLPDEMVLNCHKKSNGFSDVYGRMSWDQPSPTITGGCFNPSKGRFLHPELNRAITLREAAILQGFPNNYFFDINHGKVSIALMIGNALPPPFIAAHAIALAEQILN